MTTSTTPNTPPDSGWLTDLTEKQKQNLAGAKVDVFCGLRAANGLVMDIEDGVMRLFRDDHAEPLEFPVASTSYSRVPGTPMRPALARALVYQRDWEVQRASLTNDNGDALNQAQYDDALSEYEMGLPDLYDALIMEYAGAIFQPAVPGQGGNA
ncbi:hypothetical protein ACLGIH_20495 [Streptomyces sp. HMX87]|uniref:hypothetical protein n=1 Tax=Streptomyces sp. HMX87 TaxID=3390849 RepID=UPI003A85FA25